MIPPEMKMQKSWIYWLSVLAILALSVPTGLARAQTPIPAGPVYYVQEGDSLWDIAARFHVSQDELARANGITDPNQITIGEPLIIPGLEGIEGVLITQPVAYGETLQSLSQHYQMTLETLKRLNHITSPYEIYAGYSLVMLKNETQVLAGERATLMNGQSLLELAILHHTNPWVVLSGNGLDKSSAALPGTILRIPGRQGAGTDGLPPNITSVDVSALKQGQTAEIKVEGETGLSLSGSLGDHSVNFFADGSQQYVALQGVHAMAEPGLYPFTLQVTDPSGTTQIFTQSVLVRAGVFVYDRSLPVDPATLDPETNKVENELWFSSAAGFTPQKYWSGAFTSPVEAVFSECYTSKFGNRRSYNEGEYKYFHTGLDFCGQVGDPVYAAASGVVVFAGPLTVRGNATMIDNGWGVFTAYMHQSEILVKVGDRVKQGQLIGRVGATGRVEGPHLHFEVIVGGVQVDPLQWLGREFP